MNVRLVDLPQPVLVALRDGDAAVAERAVGLPVPAELVGHTDPVVTWEDVVAHARTLPEVEESTSYGTPAIKVAGRLMGRLRTEAEGALALRCTATDKQALVEGDDPAFFTTPHYDGHDYVLVDLERVDRIELLELVGEAWHVAAAPAVRRRHAR